MAGGFERARLQDSCGFLKVGGLVEELGLEILEGVEGGGILGKFAGEGVEGVLPDARARIRAAAVGLDCRRSSHAAYSPQHMTRHRNSCVKSHVEATKLLASVATAGYSSERTLNGR